MIPKCLGKTFLKDKFLIVFVLYNGDTMYFVEVYTLQIFAFVELLHLCGFVSETILPNYS